MKKKSILRLIIISILCLNYLTGIALAGHPAIEIMNFYADKPDDKTIIEPYIVSILALNEVANGRHLPEVKKFINWYFSKLNYPDIHGLTGTIYVYIIEDGRERSMSQYDSVDGYAGLFLHLLHQYVIKTGDVELLKNNWERVEDIAYLIPFLQDTDGLTVALPGSEIKYLMDNCEAYGGISAYLSLRRIAGKTESSYYSRVRHSVKQGILSNLYDHSSSTFSWAVEKNRRSHISWSRYYPDAYAQLLPIYYDVIKDKPSLRASLWHMFKQTYADVQPSFPVEQRIIYELTRTKMEAVKNHDS